MIIQVEDKEQLNICLEIIRSSFITVAEEFGLTENNCPSHTAFMTIDKLEKQFDEVRPMFLFYKENVPVGYFSLAKCSEIEWELNNLAVLPAYRHFGIGKAIVDYAIGIVKNYGGNKISIGIIEENTKLKNWYLKLGFKYISTRKFEHLPFTVGFMELEIQKRN
ncbi:MAG: GNAT family N-acetyltransferase [Clostridia bacterium]|nr:GNAT family N-acetyltransferase [Clostridia bacterium]